MEAPEFGTEKHHSFDSKLGNGADHFLVEDLLDFSNDLMEVDGGEFSSPVDGGAFATANSSTDSNSTAPFDGLGSCNSPLVYSDDPHFCNQLSVPYDDMAELEWLSNFVEESFSSDDLQKLHLISGPMMAGNFESGRSYDSSSSSVMIPITGTMVDVNGNNGATFDPDMSVQAKVRSKRSRAAPCNWASRLLVVSASISSSDSNVVLGQPNHPMDGKKTLKPAVARKKRDDGDNGDGNGEGRKCLHCATDKTPQWRTGPLGPKTLCNACGVRYKSGRLVPEYRPAASPTFMLTKHSNSHRKVLELRRQKELMRAQQQLQQQQQLLLHHQNMVFNVSDGDDYLIHQHMGSDFRRLI